MSEHQHLCSFFCVLIVIVTTDIWYRLMVWYILGPTARWCPMSNHFLTRWVPRLLVLALVSWATTRVGVHHLFPFTFQISVFLHSLFRLPLDFICVSSLRLAYQHPFGRPFIYIFKWVSRLGTGSSTRCCGRRGRAGVHNIDLHLFLKLKMVQW